MKLRALVIMALGFLTTTCMQAPIFYIISTETAPKKPRIEGAPTNMALFNWEGTPVMFVASGRLHWYAKTNEDAPADPNKPGAPPAKISKWDLDEFNIPQPGGKITSIAVTKSRLYALSIDNQSSHTILRYIKSGQDEWTDVSPYPDYPIQSIFADPEREHLFAGARKNNTNSFAILYMDDELKMLKDGTALLSGAVHRNGFFYLSTKTNMIYQVDLSPAIRYELTDKDSPTSEKPLFMSIFKLKDTKGTIIAIARRDGVLYEVKEGMYLSPMKHTGSNNNGNIIKTERYASGALALWEDNENRGLKKFIAGIQGGLYATTTTITSSSTTAYTHGYVEFTLNSDGSFNTNISRDDSGSGSMQTVDNNDRYTTSLGKHPINHLFQAPPEIDDYNRTFFASTQTAGLWSYRDRPDNGGPQWNAEE
jgi:hypothetical protein